MNAYEKLKEQVIAAQKEIFDPIMEILNAGEEDSYKYYDKGVNSAGSRLRKRLQEVRKSIKPQVVKQKMTELTNGAKALRTTLVEEARKANAAKKAAPAKPKTKKAEAKA